MCGIIASIFKNQAVLPFLLEGLKKEEYRGYDSCGVAIIEPHKIHIQKEIGRIEKLKEHLFTSSSKVGIGHTRWATHGKNNLNNAHPHISNKGLFCLVHNGTIYNYQEIKEDLLNKGYLFYSQTDTECIVNLLEHFYLQCGDILSSLNELDKTLKGTYVLCILFKEENRIYFLKKSTPLMLGKSKNGLHLSSDMRALELATDYLDIEDNEYGFIDENHYEIYKAQKRIEKKLYKIQKEKEDTNQVIPSFYMEKEIHEIPMVIDRIIKHYQNDFDIKIKEVIKKANNLIFVGSGTSYHAALRGSLYFENKNVQVILASEFDLNSIKNDNALYIFLSQSGETLDVLKVLEKVSHYDTLGISNVANSSLLRKCKYALEMKAKEEVAVASTKAYVAEVLLLYLLAKGINQNTLQNLKDIQQEIKDHLLHQEKILSIAESIKNKENAYFLAKGKDIYLCKEASLKLKEVTYIHSECLFAGELKHGPIALLEKDFPIFFITSLKNKENLNSAIEEVTAREGIPYIFTYDEHNPLGYLPLITDFFLLSFHLAKMRKKDVDKPRNLAKSVTVD